VVDRLAGWQIGFVVGWFMSLLVWMACESADWLVGWAGPTLAIGPCGFPMDGRKPSRSRAATRRKSCVSLGCRTNAWSTLCFSMHTCVSGMFDVGHNLVPNTIAAMLGGFAGCKQPGVFVTC